MNLNESNCPHFVDGEDLVVRLQNGQNTEITQLNTNQTCQPLHPKAQIQADFRKLIAVDPQNSTLTLLDEDNNTFELTYDMGCIAATQFIDDIVYLGTGWQEEQIFLPNNGGSCHIVNSRIVQ